MTIAAVTLNASEGSPGVLNQTLKAGHWVAERDERFSDPLKEHRVPKASAASATAWGCYFIRIPKRPRARLVGSYRLCATAF
jgi:hypothetical protein